MPNKGTDLGEQKSCFFLITQAFDQLLNKDFILLEVLNRIGAIFVLVLQNIRGVARYGFPGDELSVFGG